MEDSVDIAKLIHNGGVFKDVEGNTPEEIYKNLSGMLKLPDYISAETVCKALCEREKVMSTAVGNCIALPHSRSPILKEESEQCICVVYPKNALDMKAPDDRLVTTMFVLLSQNSQVHLKILGKLASLFRNPRFTKALEIKADEEILASIIRDLG